jgi:hypothetical protein
MRARIVSKKSAKGQKKKYDNRSKMLRENMENNARDLVRVIMRAQAAGLLPGL